MTRGMKGCVPSSRRNQLFHQSALPGFAIGAARPGQGFSHFEIETPPDQFQPLGFVAPKQIILQLAVDHDIGVQLIDIQMAIINGTLEAGTEGFYLGKLRCVEPSSTKR